MNDDKLVTVKLKMARYQARAVLDAIQQQLTKTRHDQLKKVCLVQSGNTLFRDEVEALDAQEKALQDFQYLIRVADKWVEGDMLQATITRPYRRWHHFAYALHWYRAMSPHEQQAVNDVFAVVNAALRAARNK